MPGGGQTEKIQSDDYNDGLIFFFSTPRLDVRHVASSPEASPVLKLETEKLYSAGILDRVLAQSSILASRSPTHQVI